MEKRICFLIILAGMMIQSSGLCWASVDWTMMKQYKFDEKPLDITSSPKGEFIFILVPGKILVYSDYEKRLTTPIPIEKGFNRITYSERNQSIIATGEELKLLKIIKVEQVFNIDYTGSPYIGSLNAPVTLTVFSDYQCPHCLVLEEVLQDVLKKYRGKIRLIVKNNPLDIDDSSALGAKAALAAAMQGKFEQFHEVLFKNSESIDVVSLSGIANQLNMDMNKFKRDMHSPLVDQIIQRDIANAKQIGVTGTPALFINGKRLKNRSFGNIMAKVEAELNKNKD